MEEWKDDREFFVAYIANLQHQLNARISEQYLYQLRTVRPNADMPSDLEEEEEEEEQAAAAPASARTAIDLWVESLSEHQAYQYWRVCKTCLQWIRDSRTPADLDRAIDRFISFFGRDRHNLPIWKDVLTAIEQSPKPLKFKEYVRQIRQQGWFETGLIEDPTQMVPASSSLGRGADMVYAVTSRAGTNEAANSRHLQYVSLQHLHKTTRLPFATPSPSPPAAAAAAAGSKRPHPPPSSLRPSPPTPGPSRPSYASLPPPALGPIPSATPSSGSELFISPPPAGAGPVPLPGTTPPITKPSPPEEENEQASKRQRK